MAEQCCQHEQDHITLATCLDSFHASQLTSDPSSTPHAPLTVVQYHSTVLPYAVYGYVINSIFTENHGYHMRYHLGKKSDNYYPADVRWNYIRVLLDHLEELADAETETETKIGVVEGGYVLYLDSDFIIVSPTSLHLHLQSLIETHSSYDIFLSEEASGEASGVGQCGSLLLKNTPWTRDFLALWWEQRTPIHSTSQHDQQAFSKLFLTNALNASEHIKILPIDSLNSAPLVPLHYKDTSSVLHLMGQSMHLRNTVFQRGVQSICSDVVASSASNGVMPQVEQHKKQQHQQQHQHGITPSFVLHTTLHELQTHINSSILLLATPFVPSSSASSTSGAMTTHTVLEHFRALRVLRRYTNELKHYLPHMSAPPAFVATVPLTNITTIYDHVKQLTAQLTAADLSEDAVKLSVWNQYTEVGFEYFNTFSKELDESAALTLVREIDYYNDLILSAVVESEKRFYYDRKVALCTMLAMKFQHEQPQQQQQLEEGDASDWNGSSGSSSSSSSSSSEQRGLMVLHYAQLGVQVYDSFVAPGGETTTGREVLELLGTSACQQKRYEAGLSALRRVVTWYATRRRPELGAGGVGEASLNHVRSLLNIGECMVELL